jgi:hypothetical protein
MSDYIFWKTSDGSIMVEVYSFNQVRIAQVQKELIDQGYYIISMCGGCFENSTFIRVGKLREDDDKEN